MNNLKYPFLLVLFLNVFVHLKAGAQHTENDTLPLKLHHAEPLYIDLIRDLGARKGEKEWNVGLGLNDKLDYDKYELLVEYEWAPVNRLGLEVEVPVSIFSPNSKDVRDQKPSNRVESLKTAVQYTFMVSEKYKTSMAIGYINELELHDLDKIGSAGILQGNLYNPFFVAAKQLNPKWHTLIYTGPQVIQHFRSNEWHVRYALNSNLHYMLPHSRNFVGVELNKQYEDGDFSMKIRPQMRLSIMDNLLVGLVAGIPVSRKHERLSNFVRLIYEPSHRHRSRRSHH